MQTSEGIRLRHQSSTPSQIVQGGQWHPPGPDRLIGSYQLANILGIKPRTVRQNAESGELPGLKVGKLWKFWISDIDKWLLQRQAAFASGGTKRLRQVRRDKSPRRTKHSDR